MADTSIATAVNNLDISAIIASAAPMTDALNKALSDSQAATAAGQAAAGAVAGGAALSAKGKIAVDRANEEAALKLKNDNSYAADLVGLTPGAWDDLAIQSLGNFRKASTEAMGQLSKIKSMQATSFWDAPLDFIGNQIALPFEKDTLASIADERAVSLSTLEAMSKVFENSAKINQSIDTGASAARMVGLSNMALGEAAQTAGQAQMAAARLGIDQAKFFGQINTQIFGVGLTVLDAQEKMISLRMRMEEGERSAERLEIDKAHKAFQDFQRQLQTDDRDARKAADVVTLSYVNNASKVFGMQTFESLQAFYKSNPKMKSFLESVAYDPDVINGLLGPDPAAAYLRLTQSGAPIPEGMRQTVAYINTIQQKVIAGNTGWGELKPEQRVVELNKAIQKTNKDSLSIIPAEGGFYSPPPLKAMLSVNSEVAGLKISQYLRPLAESNDRMPSDPGFILRAAQSLIAEGKSNPQEMATEIQKLFFSGVGVTSTTKQYNKFLLPGPNPLDPNSQFLMIVPNLTPSGILRSGNQDTQTLNMFSAPSISTYLLRQSVGKTPSISPSAPGGYGPRGFNIPIDNPDEFKVRPLPDVFQRKARGAE